MRGKKVMVVILCALLLFEALAFTFVSLGQQKALADPGEETFYSTASDGYLKKGDTIYNWAHDAANAEEVNDSDYVLIIGQLCPICYIWRSALFFDTSSLPDGVDITSATLSLYGDYDWSVADFDITVVDGSLLNDPLIAGDYGYLGGQTISGGAFNTSGFLEDVYNDIPLNAAGMGWISKTGMTQFGLRSSRDINANEPSGDEEIVWVYSYEQGEGYRPKLVVTYEYPPTGVPTMSQWGMIGMAIVLAAFLAWSVRRRLVASAGKS